MVTQALPGRHQLCEETNKQTTAPCPRKNQFENIRMSRWFFFSFPWRKSGASGNLFIMLPSRGRLPRGLMNLPGVVAKSDPGHILHIWFIQKILESLNAVALSLRLNFSWTERNSGVVSSLQTPCKHKTLSAFLCQNSEAVTIL